MHMGAIVRQVVEARCAPEATSVLSELQLKTGRMGLHWSVKEYQRLTKNQMAII